MGSGFRPQLIRVLVFLGSVVELCRHCLYFIFLSLYTFHLGILLRAYLNHQICRIK